MDTLYDVVGYEGLYKINKNGDVWNCKRNKFISVHYDKDGYKIVSLKGSKKLHRLLAINFIPNPENLPIIDHIDRIKTNNTLDNLRWTSNSTNQQNTTKRKNNTTGFKHIYTYKKNYINGNIDEYWVIQIKNENFKCYFQYSKNKYNLEEVVEFRNKIYIDNNIQKYD